MEKLNMIERWHQVREQIQNAAKRSNRIVNEIHLVAASKFHTIEKISSLAEAGQIDFGENYVQEALNKQSELSHLPIRWHFIGRMQTNKAKNLAGNFYLLHSLDSLKMAQALHKKCIERNIIQPVLLQINISQEEQKGGILPKQLTQLAHDIFQLNGLELQGLMCMPPYFDDGEESRPYFAELRKLKQELEAELGKTLEHLSMGMSGDFIQAIEEGATLVRIGTTIFGSRPAKQS